MDARSYSGDGEMPAHKERHGMLDSKAVILDIGGIRVKEDIVKNRSPEALRRADVRRCGTLWVAGPATAGEHPAAVAGVRIRVVTDRDVEALHRAMVAAEADNPGLARVRIRGKRLGYLAEPANTGTWAADIGDVLAYGWIARSGDTVNDLGFDLDLPPGEAWIYDCATVPQARGKGLYAALLVAMRHDFATYSIRHGWIGTAPRNWASQRGIARAGFVKVADMDWSEARATAYGVPGVSPELLHVAAFALGDGPDARLLPNAGIPVVEGELARAHDDGSALPTDLMRFRAKYGEQIAWRTVSTEIGSEPQAGAVTLRCQGRHVTLAATAPFAVLVAALDDIAPDLPWLDTDLSDAC